MSDEGGVSLLSQLLLRLPLPPTLLRLAEDDAEPPPPAAAGYGAQEEDEEVAVGALALELLQRLAIVSRRVSRALCCAPHLPRIAQAILSGGAAVVSRASELLGALADAQPSVAPILFRCGAFVHPVSRRTAAPRRRTRINAGRQAATALPPTAGSAAADDDDEEVCRLWRRCRR